MADIVFAGRGLVIGGTVPAGDLIVAFEELPLERVEEAWHGQAKHPHTKLVLVP